MDKQKEYPWQGNKCCPIMVKFTLFEREEIEKRCVELGGVTMSHYFRQLHHKAMGRLKEGGR